MTMKKWTLWDKAKKLETDEPATHYTGRFPSKPGILYWKKGEGQVKNYNDSSLTSSVNPAVRKMLPFDT